MKSAKALGDILLQSTDPLQHIRPWSIYCYDLGCLQDPLHNCNMIMVFKTSFSFVEMNARRSLFSTHHCMICTRLIGGHDGTVRIITKNNRNSIHRCVSGLFASYTSKSKVSSLCGSHQTRTPSTAVLALGSMKHYGVEARRCSPATPRHARLCTPRGIAPALQPHLSCAPPPLTPQSPSYLSPATLPPPPPPPERPESERPDEPSRPS